VPRDVIVHALERSFPMLEGQCLDRARRRPAAGSSTFRFVVRDGLAASRTVASTTSRDGVDQCLVRALADVRFPSTAGATEVSYVLSYAPSFR
jgi:hypothetical protein